MALDLSYRTPVLSVLDTLQGKALLSISEIEMCAVALPQNWQPELQDSGSEKLRMAFLQS